MTTLVPLRFETTPDPARRQWSTPGEPWCKTPPAFLLDLSDTPEAPPDLALGPQLSQPRWLEAFESAHLAWTNFVIQDGLCVPIYADDPASAVGGLIDWPGMDHVAGLVRTSTGIAALATRLDGAERIPGRTLLASNHESSNWGMWLLYTLPALQHFIAHRPAYDRVLVTAEHPNMVALLHRLGLTPDDYILHDFQRTYWCEQLHLIRQPRPDLYVPATLRALAIPSATPTKRLYVGRRRRSAAQAYRPLLNEADLIQALTPLGFTEVDPEYLSADAQIEAFTAAEAVVALGGAGLFNAIFCRPGTKIVTIESTPHFLPSHSTLLASCAHRYGMVIGQNDPADPTPWNKRWTLRVPEAAAAIATFMDQR